MLQLHLTLIFLFFSFCTVLERNPIQLLNWVVLESADDAAQLQTIFPPKTIRFLFYMDNCGGSWKVAEKSNLQGEHNFISKVQNFLVFSHFIFEQKKKIKIYLIQFPHCNFFYLLAAKFSTFSAAPRMEKNYISTLFFSVSVFNSSFACRRPLLSFSPFDKFSPLHCCLYFLLFLLLLFIVQVNLYDFIIVKLFRVWYVMIW